MVAFTQLDWVAFVAFFILVMATWFRVYGLGYYSTWYQKLHNAMLMRYNWMGWGVYHLWTFFWSVTAVLAWLALFLFWRDLSLSKYWEAGIILFLVSLVLAKLFEPVMFGGPDNPPWHETRVRLIWLAFHALLIALALAATAWLFALANKELGWPGSGRVSFGFLLVWGLFALAQFIWTCMAAHTWIHNASIVPPEEQQRRATQEALKKGVAGGFTWFTAAPFGFPTYPRAPFPPRNDSVC